MISKRKPPPPSSLLQWVLKTFQQCSFECHPTLTVFFFDKLHTEAKENRCNVILLVGVP